MTRDFFDRKTKDVAKALLGKILVRRINNEFITGKIVEVEAYIGEQDPAAHAFAGRTERSRSSLSQFAMGVLPVKSIPSRLVNMPNLVSEFSFPIYRALLAPWEIYI